MTSVTELEQSRTLCRYCYRLGHCWWFSLAACWARMPLSIDWLVLIPQNLDQALRGWINTLFDDRNPLYIGMHRVLAVQNGVASTRELLARAWDCLTSWQPKSPSSHRLPQTVLLLGVLFIVAFCQGLEDFQPVYLLISGAVLLRVGHLGFLQPRVLLTIVARGSKRLD